MAEDESAADKLARAVRETKPSWMADGFGILGPQPEQSLSALEASDGVIRREPKQPAFPADQTGGEAADLTNEDIYGAKNAAPALFHVAITAATTSPPP